MVQFWHTLPLTIWSYSDYSFYFSEIDEVDGNDSVESGELEIKELTS